MRGIRTLAIFLIFIPIVAQPEQYEAIPFKGRSLIYLNSFGILNGDYERVTIPRLISYLPGKRLITNLTNLNGETSFQLAYFHRLGFNNAFTFSFSRTYFSQDSVSSTFTQMFTDELYDDGENDTLITIQEDRTEDEDGTPMPYQESYYMEFYAGYGHIISEKVRVGLGFSYIRDSESKDYDGLEIGGTSFGLYNFGTSTLKRRVENTYDLINAHLISSDEETEEGTFEQVKDRYFIFGGVDFFLGKGWRISVDILLSYGKLSTNGSGIYTHTFKVGDTQVYAESFTSTNSISSYLLTIGTAFEVEKRIGDHVFFLDVGYERTPGNVDKGRVEEQFSLKESPHLSDVRVRNEIAKGDYSGGRIGASTLVSVSARGIYEGWEKLSLGYGVEYVKVKERHERGRVEYSYMLSEVYDDGDRVSDNDDYTLTAEAEKSVFINSYTLTEHIAFPLVFLIDTGKGFKVILGARYSLERVRKSVSLKHLSAVYYQEEKLYGDGSRETGSSLPSSMEGVWLDENTEFSDYEVNTNEITSAVDLRAGLVYRGIRNLALSLMFDTGFGDGMKGALDFSKLFFSVLLRF